MQAKLKILKALGDESRVRCLLALRDGELCVCHLIALLGLAPSTVSRHLTVLREAGLLATRKEGRWVHCRRVENAAAREALAWLDGYLGNEGRAAADRRRLAAIRRRFEEAPCPA